MNAETFEKCMEMNSLLEPPERVQFRFLSGETDFVVLISRTVK